MSEKREAWRRFWPPCATVGAFAGLLVDFQGAASKVGAMWPFVDALLPIIALAGATGGSIWLAGTIWDWSRRKTYRFQALAPNLCRLAGLVSNPHHDREIRAIAFSLRELGIPVPDDDSEPETWERFLEDVSNLASHGQLRRARRVRSFGDERGLPI